MRITAKINNNVAMGLDAEGREVVVFGRGVGFGPMPYELTDTDRIQRVFHHVNDDLLQSVASIPSEALGLALDIVKIAEADLGCHLSSNLYLTLADHLQFSIERLTQGIVMTHPLESEIPLVFQREYAIGQRALEIIHREVGIAFPESEACAIALHIANAETDGGVFTANMSAVMEDLAVIDGIIEQLQVELGMTFDRSTHGYLRFVAHLRYLVKRLRKGEHAPESDSSLIDQVKKDFSQAYDAAASVARRLRRERGWRLSNEEMLYLVLYINRLILGA